VLLVHGFDGFGAKDCRAEVSRLAARLGDRAVIVGYYTGDLDPDVWLPGGRATPQTPLAELGARLADLVTSYASPVDLVGHSMGGLVIAAARAHLPVGAVRRTVMLGVPLAGLPSAVGTPVAQCEDMSPGSEFLAGLPPRPVDLVVGSEADEAVPIESALACPATAVVRLPEGRGIHHGDLILDTRVLREVVRTLR
jgi:pimeloyl-ACP methyl ester carboxylesterase